MTAILSLLCFRETLNGQEALSRLTNTVGFGSSQENGEVEGIKGVRPL